MNLNKYSENIIELANNIFKKSEEIHMQILFISAVTTIYSTMALYVSFRAKEDIINVKNEIANIRLKIQKLSDKSNPDSYIL